MPGTGVFSIGTGVIEIIASGGERLRQQIREEVARASRGIEVRIPLRVDRDEFRRTIRSTRNDLRSEGREGGRSYGRSFTRSVYQEVSGGLSSVASLTQKLNFTPSLSMMRIPLLIAGIGTALIPVVSILTSLISSLGLGLTSTLALVPAMIGLGGAVGIVMAAFKGVTKRTDEASVQFTSMLNSWKDELKGLQKIAAAEFLPGVTYFLKSAKVLLPDVKNYMHQLGTELRFTAMEAGDFVSSDLFRDRLHAIMASNVTAVSYLSQALGSIGIVFMDLAASASKLLPRLASSIMMGSTNLSMMIESKYASGELDAFFQRAGDSMAKWWSIIGNILGGVLNILRAANPSGEKLATSLERVTQKFQDWTGSAAGQKDLKEFFDFFANFDYEGLYNKITRVALAIGAVSLALRGVNLTQGLVGLAGTLASMGPVGLVILGITAAIAALAGTWTYLYQEVGPVRDLIDGVGRSFQKELMPTFDKFASFIMDRIVPALRDGAILYLRFIADLLVNTVFPALRSAGEQFLPALEAGWNRITKAFRDNKSELTTLATIFKTVVSFVASYVIPVIGFFATMFVEQFSRGISYLIRYVGFAVDVVKEVISQVIAAKNRLLGLIAWWESVFSSSVETAKRWLEALKQWFASVWASIVSAFNSAAEWVSNAWSAVWGVIQKVIEPVIAFVQFWTSIVTQLIDIAFTWIYQVVSSRIALVRDAIVWVFTGIWSFISGILTAIRDFFAPIWDSISSTVSGAMNSANNSVSSVLTTISGYISMVMSAISIAWNAAWGWIKDTVSTVWGVISGVVSSITGYIWITVSGWLGSVKDAFSTALSGVRMIWDSGWRWIHDNVVSWGDKIAGIGTSIKDRVISAIHGIPAGVVNGLNGMIDLVNDAIGVVNKILPDKMDLPTLGHVRMPPGFATGGLIRGPGTGTSDSIPLMTSSGPIMGSNGEFMIRARSTAGLMQDYGRGFLDWLNNYDVKRGDPSSVTIGPKRQYASGGFISSTQNWIKAQDPKPYVFGAAGPDAWDCSSLVGGVWALLNGKNPNRRYFLTYDLPGAGGFIPGHGLFTIGLSRQHVVGNFAGLPFEAANPSDGIIVGSGATSVDRMPAQYFLPAWGEGFMGDSGGGLFSDIVGKAIDRAVGGIRNRLPHPGGIVNNVVDGLFEKTVDGLKHMEFDSGGWLPPRSTVIASNNTPYPERVRTAGQEAALGQPIVIEKLELKIERVDDIAELMELIGSVRAVARTYGAQS